MALTRDTQKTIPILDEGASATIRKLSFRQLEAAQAEKRKAAIETIAALGDALDKLPSGGDDGAPAGRAATYDRFTVLVAGIVGWGYTEPLSPEAIGDLDEDSAQYLFDEIMDYSLRSEAEGKGLPRYSDEPSVPAAADGQGS
jgi:hypothetical protein